MVRLDIQTANITSIHGDFVKPKAKFEVGTSFGGCAVCGYWIMCLCEQQFKISLWRCLCNSIY